MERNNQYIASMNYEVALENSSARGNFGEIARSPCLMLWVWEGVGDEGGGCGAEDVA